MKNKYKNHNYRKRLAELKRLMLNPEKFKAKIGSEITEKDIPLVYEISREARIDSLIEDLEIDKKEYRKAKSKIIKLHPDSTEFPLRSILFRKHNGKYKVEELINQYHDNILKQGIEIGMDYGKKFLAEDIQNKRFTKQDIMNMSKREIDEYCDEVREEI